MDREKNIINVGLSVPARQTTSKTRVVTNNYQMVRIDWEQTDEISQLQSQQLIGKIFDIITEHPIKAIVISDYGKGTVTEHVCNSLITWAKDWIPVLVDPKGTNWKKYVGASVITPNLQELADMVKKPSLDDLEIIHHSNNLIEIYDFWSVLVTRAEQGMTLCTNSGEQYNIPAQVREVADVSGAGDTVIASLALAMSNGLEISDAMQIANVAAGISVSKKGTGTVSRDQLQKALDTLA
jgi:D-beta-D-heptose 7-phosphate kinase/D-beta-D-heptose 1-phosphate adenosyltransferase